MARPYTLPTMPDCKNCGHKIGTRKSKRIHRPFNTGGAVNCFCGCNLPEAM